MSGGLGSLTGPLRVAIVGAGPSGFYAADALLKSDRKVSVDVFDRLPIPYGLVRYGVAPDHAKIKTVTKVYEKIAQKEGFSFLGNVAIGKDISVKELQSFYDAVIFSCGAETDRKLDIPGESLKGSYTATEFVAWYNGHPDYRDRVFDLSQKAAVIVGQGNVAIDVCRILCKSVDELKATDIARHALDALAQSKIEEVHMIGRRGPAQAAFTPPEIREFLELEDCDTVVRPEDLRLNEESQKELADPQNIRCKKNFEIMTEFAARKASGKRKRFYLHFLKSPVALLGNEKVEKVILEKNALSGEEGRQKAKGTGQKEELACGMFFRSVGYHGLPIDGVPFQEREGVIPNQGGRVLSGDQIVPGLYAAGWIKRGPSGVIGTNKPDSEETVKNLLSDVDLLVPCRQPDSAAVKEFLHQKGVRVVTFNDWRKIDAEEIKRGASCGKPREKYVSVPEMLACL